MPNRFEKFVHDQNLKSFRRHIETSTDPVRLALLKTLFEEEQQRTLPSSKIRPKPDPKAS